MAEGPKDVIAKSGPHVSRHRRETVDLVVAFSPQASGELPRKEVIQPQVPLRLPCYDFTPVIDHTIGGYLPEGLKHRLPVQQTSMV